MFQYLEKLQYRNLLAPVGFTTAVVQTNYVDTKLAHWVTFKVDFGAITGDTTAINDTVGITIEASTAASSNATEAGIPFKYRLSPAAGATPSTDPLGAITAATSDGIQIAADQDNKTLFLEVDPATLPYNPGADYRYLRVVITPGSATTAGVVGASAFIAHRYPANDMSETT